MPYIRRARRIPLDPHIEALAKEIDSEGEINYCFYKLLTLLSLKNKESYSEYSKCIAALECAKLEFYRRRVVPYEQLKELENGDV